VHLPFIGSDAWVDSKVSSAPDIFRATPGVASAELVSDGKMFALKLSLAHWVAVPAGPLILAALTLMTARVTVRRFLVARG
jgi:hypothetical protein